MLAITGGSGKIGSAVITAIQQHHLTPPTNLIIATTSNPTPPHLTQLATQGATIRHVTSYDNEASLTAAFQGANKLFLVSSNDIASDGPEAPDGEGRERHHYTALRAAQAAGVRHVYYTSLAFASPSLATVMRAHTRTEAYLARQQSSLAWTALREGCYAESWPQYLDRAGGGGEAVVAGDGPVSWTAIADLGLATALVLTDATDKYKNRALYLASTRAVSLQQLAGMVSEAEGTAVGVRVVGEEEYVRYHVAAGKKEADVRWWVSTYPALQAGECDIHDTTLSELLASKGKTPVMIEEVIRKGDTRVRK